MRSIEPSLLGGVATAIHVLGLAGGTVALTGTGGVRDMLCQESKRCLRNI